MYEKFEGLLKSNHVRVSDVSRATGITPSTFTDWKKGLYQPKNDKLQKVADYFGVSLDYFLGSSSSGVRYQISAFEYEVIRAFRAYDHQDAILDMLGIERPSEQVKKEDSSAS